MKIYFAGVDAIYEIDAVSDVGVKYALTSYEKWRRTDLLKFNNTNYGKFTSVIVDSGLFSYLWGNKSHIAYDKDFYYNYLDNYSKFIEGSRFENMRFVELDVQEKLGVDFAWELREKLVGRFGKSKIINVCHEIDGDPTSLIEYADYLAVGINQRLKKYGREYIYKYIDFIYKKALTSNTKVHLLGVTRPADLYMCWGATSCDSTSWLAKWIYGNYKTHNFFSGKGSYLDVKSTYELKSLLKNIELSKNIIFRDSIAYRMTYYAAYTAYLYYQSIDPNSVT